MRADSGQGQGDQERMSRKADIPVFRLENITKRFGGLKALSGVHLSVEAGQIMGLIGPNGAGKSTLFNVATSIYKPSTGSSMLRRATRASIQERDTACQRHKSQFWTCDFCQGGELIDLSGARLGFLTEGRTEKLVRAKTVIFHRGRTCNKSQVGVLTFRPLDGIIRRL